jgi:chromosomal replication initiator protein
MSDYSHLDKRRSQRRTGVVRIPTTDLAYAHVVLFCVGAEYGLTVPELVEHHNGRCRARPRHVAMYLCRKLVESLSLSQIGTIFGGRDHASVFHSIQRGTVIATEDRDRLKRIRAAITAAVAAEEESAA